MTRSDALNNWISVLRNCFPKPAEFTHADRGNSDIYVSWQLNSDSERPNKQSKIIRIQFDSDGVRDYLDSGNHQAQRAADGQLRAWVEEKLKNHNPDHLNNPEDIPPVVAWRVPRRVIFG